MTVIGLALGALIGALAAGWTGAVLAGYVGAFGGGDLLGGLNELVRYPLLRKRWPLGTMEREALGIGLRGVFGLVLTGLGSVIGALVGYRLGHNGLAQVCGVFIGSAVGVALTSLVAKTFTRLVLRDAMTVSLGHLIVGAVTGGLYVLWSTEVAVAVGVLLGVVLVIAVGRRILPH